MGSEMCIRDRSESDEMSQMIVDIFNVIVIEPPLNTSPINVTINSEADCNEGGDPNVFCILQIKPRLFEYVNKFFAPNYFDNLNDDLVSKALIMCRIKEELAGGSNE